MTAKAGTTTRTAPTGPTPMRRFRMAEEPYLRGVNRANAEGMTASEALRVLWIAYANGDITLTGKMRRAR